MKYDLAIIGGGPAGYSAALEAIKYGLSVVLFEKELLGGTCLNRGCVPTKFLAHTSELYDNARNSRQYGVSSEGVTLDLAVTQSKMKDTVEELRNGLNRLLEENKIEVVYGKATVLHANLIACQGMEYETKNILIATGARTMHPLIRGTVDSTQALTLDRIPQTVKILGGGVVATEFANIFNKLGADVTICIRADRILRKWDKELAVGVTQQLKKQGIRIQTKCTMHEFEEGNYELILSATGREPNLEGLEHLGIQADDHNGVMVDQYGMTNIENVYAAGDVVSDSCMLAHIAMEQGKQIARHIAGEQTFDASAIAKCIYLEPEVASVGLTENEAKEKGLAVVTGKQNLRSNARTLIATEARSFLKIVAEVNTHKILGAQLMCERASDLASEFVVAINQQMTVEELMRSVHPHPSFSEAITDALVAVEGKLHEL
jgi:dihydrolipoamide dehydrogenase